MMVQLKNAILYLIFFRVALATAGYEAGGQTVRYMKTLPGITKRANVFAVEFVPHFKAEPAFLAISKKRQGTCTAGNLPCTDGLGGCCPIGKTCVQINAQPGCCPAGQICGNTSFGCLATEVDCVTYCCPFGTTCSLDTTNVSCSSGSDSDSICGMDGLSPCPNMDGCCPTGVDCIPPNLCNISCGPEDVTCGSGCCLKGLVCLADGTCGTGSDNFTPLKPSGPAATSNAPIPSEDVTPPNVSTPAVTRPEVTSKVFPTPESTTTEYNEAETTSEPTSNNYLSPTTTARLTRYVTPSFLGGAPVPTAGAMLGGALGIAAGYLNM